MPHFEPLEIANVTYDLAHLEPFMFNVTTNKVNRELIVHVRFTNHCFTKEHDALTHPVGSPILKDGGGRDRSFCSIRHGLSLQLPGLVRGFSNPAIKVNQTRERRNWVYTRTVATPAGPYHVFFEIRRAAVAGQDLNLVVESAYHQDPARGAPNILGNMKFVTLCGKTYLGEPVSTRR
jgi:hypothetical protein